jgi:mono/diheme cytochrome c family protein
MSRALSRLRGRIAATLTLPVAVFGIASPAFSEDADLIARGRYLATASDCVACHTAPDGQPMAGGLALSTPIGAIMSTNITPSKDNGIGGYTLEQFDAAVRKGVRADGKHLFPAMPYTSYALLSDDDVAALYAYFMKGVEPGRSPPCRNETTVPVQHSPVDGRLETAVSRHRPV